MALAATKTRRELVIQALSNLKVVAAGETPQDADYSTVDNHVDTTIAMMNEREIVTVTDDDAIPSAWFEPLAVILAQDAADDFIIPRNEGAVQMAERTLREINRGRPTREPLTADYF